MKRVLFITYGNPEKASKGDDLYSWNIINSIGHCNDIYLHVISYFEDAKDKSQNYYKLKEVVNKLTYVPFVYKNILAIGLSKYPAMIANRKTPEMISKVKDILKEEKYDAIIVNMFRLSYLIDHIKRFDGTKIFISHNVETQLSESTYKYQGNLLKRFAYYLDYLKTKYYEKRYLSQFDVVTTICDVDKELFKSIIPYKRIEVLPPVIDLSKQGIVTDKVENKFIICGTFHWEPKYMNLKLLLAAKNIDAFEKHNMDLMVVGRAFKKDVDYVNSHFPGIMMTGLVDSVLPFYEKARIAIVPELIGGGFKLKIAEAVQYHKPIVAIKGSVTDKMMIPGIHFIEAATFEELIDKAIQLMENKKMQEYLVQNARDLFAKRYTIDYTSNIIRNIL